MSQEYRIYPNEVSSQKAVGIKLPFNRNAYAKTAQQAYDAPPARSVGPFQQSYSTEEQAISNYINLLLTRRGERVMHPDFGTLVRDFIFEQNDEINRLVLEDDIVEATEYWLPYIEIVRINVGLPDVSEFPTNETAHGMLVSIIFKVFRAGANRTIKIFLSELGEVQTDVT